MCDCVCTWVAIVSALSLMALSCSNCSESWPYWSNASAEAVEETIRMPVHKKLLGKREKKFGTLHEFACHPCAGAMLIFSVSFQF